MDSDEPGTSGLSEVANIEFQKVKYDEDDILTDVGCNIEIEMEGRSDESEFSADEELPDIQNDGEFVENEEFGEEEEEFTEVEDVRESNLSAREEGTEENFYQCGTYNEPYVTSDEQKQHVAEVRKIERNTTYPPIPLQQHVLAHTGARKKPYQCSHCPKRFTHRGDLNQHIFTHSEDKPFKCEKCPGEKSFKTQRYLNNHMKIHAGVKPHQCNRCDMKFLRKQDLTRHQRIHLGIKPFKCGYCGKRFTRSTRLTSHIRIHTGERPYKCELCGRTFKDKGHATVHMERQKTKPIEERCDYKHDE